MKTVGFHHTIVGNIGDHACTPAHYYNFGHHIVRRFSEPSPDCDLLVVGGGSTHKACIQKVNQFAASGNPTVAWGIKTRESKFASEPETIYFNLVCSLIGTRDFDMKEVHEFVPCVSCKSKLFDIEYEVKHEVAFFKHQRKSDQIEIPSFMPTMSNYIDTLEQAIAFIGRAETVVTNSYHGTYWAQLLGKKVLCIPFSNKFGGFEFMPTTANSSNWLSKIKQARKIDGAAQIEKYRLHNDQFFEKVMNLKPSSLE